VEERRKCAELASAQVERLKAGKRSEQLPSQGAQRIAAQPQDTDGRGDGEVGQRGDEIVAEVDLRCEAQVPQVKGHCVQTPPSEVEHCLQLAFVPCLCRLRLPLALQVDRVDGILEVGAAPPTKKVNAPPFHQPHLGHKWQEGSSLGWLHIEQIDETRSYIRPELKTLQGGSSLYPEETPQGARVLFNSEHLSHPLVVSEEVAEPP